MKPLTVALTLVLTAMLSASALNLAQVASASVTTPSVPEFTAKFVDASYDVQTTYSTDPYTGRSVTHAGYHVVNRTIEVTIKNQPFTGYDSNGQKINFYLDVRTKGHYDPNWINIYSPDNGYLVQSDSSYTTISYSLDDYSPPFWDNIGDNGAVDFQVQALIGSVHRIQNGSATNILEMYPWVFDGETSQWSSIQTVSIPTQNAAATANPTVTNTPQTAQTASSDAQWMTLLTVVVVACALIVAAVVTVAAVLVRKARRTR